MKIQSIKGTRDIFGVNLKLKRFIESIFLDETSKFGFQEIETPLMEDVSLFKRSVGESSDIVQKEMFLINDDKDSITLRPEGTASVLRACIENSLFDKLPLKLSYFGPMFRKEKPQKGRYRQFYQCGVESFGEKTYGADLELFLLISNILKKLNITDYIIEINNIGTNDEREEYKKDLYAFFKQNEDSLSEESKKRLSSNVLRILDSKDQKDIDLCLKVPLIQNYIGLEQQNEFLKFQEMLLKLNIPFKINPFLVRGLDYYSDLVFEIIDTSNNLGSQTALGGGGRYDKLIEDFSNKKIPAIGFAFGVDRLMLCCKAPLTNNPIKISLNSTISDLIPIFLKTKNEFPENFFLDVNLNYNLSFKKMFQRADKISSDYVVIIGENEYQKNQFKIKNMKTGIETVVDISDYSDIGQLLLNFLKTT